MSMPRILTVTSVGLVGLLTLAGCASGAEAEPKQTTAADSVTIEDNGGSHEIATPPASVVALDNRTFQTLSDWGVELSAGAVALMPDTVSYLDDESIVDIGLHSEPDLEAIVAVDPDLIISGQRFTQHNEAIAELVPDATIIDLEPREGEPFDEELKRQVTALGEIFGKQDEAQALVDDFDEAVERAKAAYDDADTVMAVNTSGGEIGYLAPTVGRSLGPIYDILGLTPALEVEDASDDHQGDDISVEAIAASNPDWLLVLDRDAVFAAETPDYVQASEILESSEALAGVTAVADEQIVYMPTDTYLNEGIQTYTTFLNDLADALEAAQK
jgi:iron complex transport system substrate-binding protein